MYRENTIRTQLPGLPLHTSQYHRYWIVVANADTTALDSTTALHYICIYFFVLLCF